MYHQSDKRDNCQRISTLRRVEDQYDYSNIQFPVSYQDIERFEILNQLCIYVYAIDEDDNIYPEYHGNDDYFETCIYLLRLEEEEKSHYVYIKHPDHFFHIHTHARTTGDIFCPCCQKGVRGDTYARHRAACYKFHKSGDLLQLPEPRSTMKFESFKEMLKRQHIASLDFGATLKRCGRKDDNDDAKRELLAQHVPNSACILFENTINPTKSRVWCRRSENIAVEVLEVLLEMQEEVSSDIKFNQQMVMTEQDCRNYNSTNSCYLCDTAVDTSPRKKQKE